jgi:hypothetical protein
MKKSCIIFAFTLALMPAVFAQSAEAMKKIEAARIALITERLELSPDQAERFWPVYREYTDKRRDLREQMRDMRQQANPNELSEEESKKMVAAALAMRERELSLEKEYSGRMLSVISTQQLLKLRNAEKDFQQMLLQRLQTQRDRQLQQQKMQERRELLRERRNN